MKVITKRDSKGRFLKGNQPWLKGKKVNRNKYPNLGHFVKHSKKAKEKMREASNGKIAWNKGLTKETDKRVRKKAFNQIFREKKKCEICGKPHLNKKFCSVRCMSLDYKSRVGYWKGKKISKVSVEKMRETMLKQYKNGKTTWNKGLTGEEFKKHYSNGMGGFVLIDQAGKNHYNWQGGISFEPYGVEFNNELKEQIRERDRYRCQQCFRHQDELGRKLDIHHIDFNKKNNDPNNLISLCRNCHAQIQFNKKDWVEYFSKVKSPTSKSITVRYLSMK